MYNENLNINFTWSYYVLLFTLISPCATKIHDLLNWKCFKFACYTGLFHVEESCDDYSWYARVIAIHLASTGNPVPRIGTNIRYREIFFLLQVILPVAGVQMTTNDTAQKSSPLQPTTNQEEPELKSHTENQCNAANFLTVALLFGVPNAEYT